MNKTTVIKTAFACLTLLLMMIMLPKSSALRLAVPTSPVQLDATGSYVGNPHTPTAPTLRLLTGVKLLCYEANSSCSDCARLSTVISDVTTLTDAAALPSILNQYDALYVAYGSVHNLSPYAATIQPYIQRGRGIVIEQPSITGTVSILPPGFEVTVSGIWWPSYPDMDSLQFTAEGLTHPILQGLSPTDLSGNFDTVYTSGLGNGFTRLAAVADHPSVIALAAGQYGVGRIVFHTGSISTCSWRQGSDSYIQNIVQYVANQSVTEIYLPLVIK